MVNNIDGIEERCGRYTVSGTDYRLVGTTVVIEHEGGYIEMYRRCTTKEEAQAKLESLVIKAASEAMFESANDEQIALA